MSKLLKKQSKRRTCRLKYKIVRKVAEHKRKLKREKKKNPSYRKPKDPGVPNSLPFKDEILQKAYEMKFPSKDVQKNIPRSSELLSTDLKQVVDEAESSLLDFQLANPDERCPNHPKDVQGNNSKTFFKDLKQVVEEADVVLEVLDARDPLGTRSREIEDLVIRSGKKLVLVLNKIDLVPSENMDQWLKYLRMSLPTVAFKASTQNQAKNLSQSKTPAIHVSRNLQQSSRCIGGSHVLKVLGNYCRNKNIQTSIKVGVVGLPNVGKSSLINSLKRSRACGVGGMPGFTKSIQEVSLTKHIKLIDCPGVVLANEVSSTHLSLRNALKVEKLKDVLTPAEAIVQRVDKRQLCLQYTVPEFKSSHELFAVLAKRMGKMKKGGMPNIEEGARRIINDWNRGKIRYYTTPPEKFDPEVYLTTEIVEEMAQAFDFSSLGEEQMNWE